ncbi:triose-phosphate isomerase [Altererythrobacter sp.]|uniref:triose-phosphate isomerase n=1 Tax=Altererythrobacter sp. TaxID=1872480 RepID=UPI001B0EC096|nr:triose-phosphate isomerase [Altererythrobacter sp.]MBO6608283.1 triose-phosphate isomerase [Altererythrobacter sp.]MBO6641461.1 triose-phosphate isomerase [Altererythrobacter sp.]MBO6707840.1 triose-phosphate isomerase [Altererythrobacter sp.]MBO6946028.1 triose-phosphate isomerase [Altererythrobacter sp.]
MAERPYIVGNWKMNGTRAMLSEARTIDRAAQRHMKVEVAIAPPYTLIHAVHREVEQIGVGAQDCHPGLGGAFTGDISAPMVADAGAKFVIVGHSERRQGHGESNVLVREKAQAALDAGMRVIMCCGEDSKAREDGKAVSFVTKQLKASLPEMEDAGERLTVAYEPIWAIGTGNTATTDDIAAMHAEIRELLVKLYGEEQGSGVRILYGGSVNPDNAREILSTPEVGGALVGGASLTADSFMGIALAAGDPPEG